MKGKGLPRKRRRKGVIGGEALLFHLSFLISVLSKRAVEILNKIDFSPHALREGIDGLQIYVDYLYSASELLDRAADIASESAILVHDNEKRWRMFNNKVAGLSKK